MIIDAHAHVYADPKIEVQPGHMMMSAEEQLTVMERLGIDKAVILPLNNPEGIGERQSMFEILGICEKHPGKFIPFCNVDPRQTNAPEPMTERCLEYMLNQYKNLGCKGLGEINAKIYWDDPLALRLFKMCEKVGFPVTFHTTIAGSDDYGLLDEIGFPRFEKVLQKFPRLIFFGHSQSFWAEISGDITKEDKCVYPEGPVKPAGAVSRLMRKYPQLYGDLSAKSALNALTRDLEHAYGFINEFQDRLLFGMDYCSLNDKHDLAGWLQTAVNKGHITKQAFEKIVWKNINEILSLGIS